MVKIAKGKNNLKVPTSEQARINGRKGGLASAANKKKKAEEKDRLKLLMSLPVVGKKSIEQLKTLGLDPALYDNEMLVDVVLWQQALKGDVGAIKYIDERLGRSPQLKLKQDELEIKKKSLEKETVDTAKLDSILKAVENID